MKRKPGPRGNLRDGASLYQRGYTVGSAGNISARLDDGWLITPTDACLGRLDPADIAKVDRGGQCGVGRQAVENAGAASRHLRAQRAKRAASSIPIRRIWLR